MRQGSQDELLVNLANEADRKRAQAALGTLSNQTGNQAMNALGLSNGAIGNWVNSANQTTGALLGGGSLLGKILGWG